MAEIALKVSQDKRQRSVLLRWRASSYGVLSKTNIPYTQKPQGSEEQGLVGECWEPNQWKPVLPTDPLPG